MKFQKSQAIVEFALILPLFLFIVFAIFYICSAFADYLYLSAIVRNSARAASVISTEEYKQQKYESVYTNFKDAELPIKSYDWNPTDSNQFSIKYVKESQNVEVNVLAKLNSNGLGILDVVNNLGKIISNDNNDTMDKFDLKIKYEMRSENIQE